MTTKSRLRLIIVVVVLAVIAGGVVLVKWIKSGWTKIRGGAR